MATPEIHLKSADMSMELTQSAPLVRSVAFSPDMRFALSGSMNDTATLWDLTAATAVRTFSAPRGYTGDGLIVAFSKDGLYGMTGGKGLKIWDLSTGGEVKTIGDRRTMSIAVSPDKQSVLTGEWPSEVFSTPHPYMILWDINAGSEIRGYKDPEGSAVSTVAISPDGRYALSGHLGGKMFLWDVASGRVINSVKADRAFLAPDVNSVAFSPDGRRIVTCSWDHTAKVWDASSGKELLNLKGHTRRLHGVAFSPDGRQIATGSEDHTAKLWDSFGGKELLTLKGHNDSVNRLSFSPDGRRILTGSNDRTARIWETATGRELLTLKGQGSLILGVGFSPDGERIVTGGADNAAKLWEASSGQELLTLNGHTAWARCVAFSPDGQRIVTGSWDQTAKVWQSATAQEVAGWKREEKAADERAALLRQSEAAGAELERARRAREPGAITQWLILAPIPFETRGQPGSGLVALDQEQIPLEARLRPRAGNRVKAAENELVWSALQMEDGVIDLDPIVTQQAEFSVAYAVCYILSEADHGALLMKVGTIGQAKIYLNGKQIYWFASSRANVPEQNVVTGVELRAGVNLLVFKLVNELGPWQGWVRLTDAAGQPVKGTSVTVIPP